MTWIAEYADAVTEMKVGHILTVEIETVQTALAWAS